MEFQMRNKTFISSMVGVAAAAAVAGSANAGVTIDSFTNSTVYQDETSFGSIFNSRDAFVGGSGGSNLPTINTVTNRLNANTGANATITVDWLNLDANGFGPNIDLSQLSTITFDVTSSAASKITFGIQQMDSAGTIIGSVRWATVAIAQGSSSVTLTVGQDSGGTWSTTGTGLAALSNVTKMSMTFGKTGTGAASFDGSIGNLQYNLVPAPGALALLGVAGLAARRRRA
jgi:hypothetical protein